MDKKKKQNWTWYSIPTVPATGKAEAGSCKFEGSLTIMVRPHLKEKYNRSKRVDQIILKVGSKRRSRQALTNIEYCSFKADYDILLLKRQLIMAFIECQLGRHILLTNYFQGTIG